MTSFAALMQEWLYGEAGYYRHAQIGKAGDFYTSVSVGSYFGATIGNFFVRFLQNKKASFVEFGASRGELISDVAQYVRQYYPDVFDNIEWIIIEPLRELRELQRAYWESHVGKERLNIFETFRIFSDTRLFIVANEFFDAFPCELYKRGKQGFVDNEGKILFLDATLELQNRAEMMNVEYGEFAVGVREFIHSLDSMAKDWLFLTFDYGEDYARNDFSLRIFHNHRVLNLSDFIGDIRPFFAKSDITSDVNFAELTRFFHEVGARRIYFARENRALLEMGLPHVIEQKSTQIDDKRRAQEMLQIRTLLDPGILGERFKCACFVKGEIDNNLFLRL